MAWKPDLGEFDLSKLDLTKKYDRDLSLYETLNWKDRLLLYISLALFLVFIIWANVTQVDELARGVGRVIPSSEVQVVQNLEGGIVDEFLVKEDEVVQKGQILMRMSNIKASAEYQASLSRYLGLQAAIARLQAEAEVKPLKFDDELRQRAPRATELEKATYAANMRKFNGQQKIMQKQLDQRLQELEEIKGQIEGTKKVLDISLEERGLMAPLVESGSLSKLELLQQDSKIAGQETNLKNLKVSLERVEATVKEAQERLEEHKSSLEAEVRQKITELTNEANTLKETLAAFKDREQRTELRSPVYGIVKDIKIKTIGGVIQPGEDIVDIVPLEDQLIVEADISPSDIAFLHPDQEAKIKLTAYDYSIYGGLDGKVIEISADTIENDKGDSFYRIKLQSNKTNIEHNGKVLPIMPGMIAQVDIMTGKKTIMNYLLKPFRKTLDNALHER